MTPDGACLERPAHLLDVGRAGHDEHPAAGCCEGRHQVAAVADHVAEVEVEQHQGGCSPSTTSRTSPSRSLRSATVHSRPSNPSARARLWASSWWSSTSTARVRAPSVRAGSVRMLVRHATGTS